MYKVENGIIYTSNGMPYNQRVFCDNRLAIQSLNDGIGDVDYFNPNTSGHTKVFWRNFWGSMKFYLKNEHGNKMIRAKHCEIYPFGYKSSSDLCEHSIYVVKDCIFITVTPNENSDLNLEFYEDLLAYPDKYYKTTPTRGNVICRSSVNRSWKYPILKNGEVRFGYNEGEYGTYIRIFSSMPAQMIKTPKTASYTKYTVSFIGLQSGKPFTVAISFSPNENCAEKYNYNTLIDGQFKRYKKVLDKSPVLKSKHDLLNQYFELMPLYHESLKVTDFKGAIRPQTLHYWVFGWDSLTSNESTFYWGDDEFIGDMLTCFEENADDYYGVAHMFSRNTKGVFFGKIDPASQAMYITLLDLYRIAGGNFAKHYNFAKKLFAIIKSTEILDTGFCKGRSLYPDFAEVLKENNNDISCFNNSVCYCAMRSMQDIALAVGDEKTANSAKNMADNMQKRFSAVMFNTEMGFFDSSVDATNYKWRGIPTNNGIKWENDYCEDLVCVNKAQCLDFYEKNIVCSAGLRPIPDWIPAYDKDANQLHCWWPVMSEFYTRLLNNQNRPDRMNQFIGWVEYWSEKLMCPEGISCYDDNPEVPFDNWNCYPGIWQAYSIRGFYNAVVHSVLGISVGKNKINFHPYSGEEMELDKLHFGKRIFNIKMHGSGSKIEKVIVNGENMGEVYSLDIESLSETNYIEVHRCNV